MPAKPIELQGARVLVLGGSGVLGSSIAADLTGRGSSVVLAGRDRDRLRKKASELGDLPTVAFDMKVPADGRRVVEASVDALGGLDGIVNAAGVVAFGPLAELTDQTLEELVIVDFMGPLRIIRIALPYLENGFVVNLTGVVAESPVAGMVAYSATKAGLSAATRGLGRELRRSNIHFLDARPPHTETGLAGRPIAGTAPRMPDGLDPVTVARVIVDGLAKGEKELATSAFQG
jgi:cyclic-di-GMP-binding biofilm dispersal mediator protein